MSIPVVLLSIGAQSGPDGTFSNLQRLEVTAKRLFAAVLERSSEIVVRGERTADYVRSLGFDAVPVIGCPSLTWKGPQHRVREFQPGRRLKVAYNVQSSKDIGPP